MPTNVPAPSNYFTNQEELLDNNWIFRLKSDAGGIEAYDQLRNYTGKPTNSPQLVLQYLNLLSRSRAVVGSATVTAP